ncbi:hypothetical protein GCM10027256_30500 [Novispirillum itersonii subsp. nipponicum]
MGAIDQPCMRREGIVFLFDAKPDHPSMQTPPFQKKLSGDGSYQAGAMPRQAVGDPPDADPNPDCPAHLPGWGKRRRVGRWAGLSQHFMGPSKRKNENRTPCDGKG